MTAFRLKKLLLVFSYLNLKNINNKVNKMKKIILKYIRNKLFI